MKFLRRNQTRRRFFCLLFFTGLFGPAAYAATVRGTVTDSLGAVIAGARIELMAKQKMIVATADGTGR